ncbi:MAG: hypothetical protein M3O15_02230 [Acidobacteriota bacterium]|nr:hypothetical protein [Acidobacteriota bacterium]
MPFKAWVQALCAALCVVLGAEALGAAVAGPPPPWLPEGYVILSFEEVDKLLHTGQGTALGEIFRRNADLLARALAKLTPEELDALRVRMHEYRAQEVPAQELHNYSEVVELHAAERLRLLRSRAPAAFDSLVKAQEETTSGFADDRETVGREAIRLEQLIGKQPDAELYLAVLRPLRARPWNRDARRVLHAIVDHDEPAVPIDRDRFLTLRLGALDFIHKREVEQPAQGAWFSLEASFHKRDADFGEVRPLWERAVALQARDDETHSMAIILARLDGDAAREQKALEWVARDGVTDKEAIEAGVRLFGDRYLPENLRERLYHAALHAPGGATDWEGRLEQLEHSSSIEFTIRETAKILGIPEASLPPQPYRAELLALNLRSRIIDHHFDQEPCDEVAKELPALETQAAAAYPAAADPNLPPRPHAPAEVMGLRQELAEMKEAKKRLSELAASHRDPEGQELTAEAEAELSQMRAAIESDSQAAAHRLAGKSDGAVVAEWNRRELEEWRKEHLEKRGSQEVLPLAEAERLTFRVRAALADCYSTGQRYREAAAVIERCMLPRPQVDSPCTLAYLNLGMQMAQHGQAREAESVYRKLAAAGAYPELLPDLRKLIDSPPQNTP